LLVDYREDYRGLIQASTNNQALTVHQVSDNQASDNNNQVSTAHQASDNKGSQDNSPDNSSLDNSSPDNNSSLDNKVDLDNKYSLDNNSPDNSPNQLFPQAISLLEVLLLTQAFQITGP